MVRCGGVYPGASWSSLLRKRSDDIRGAGLEHDEHAAQWRMFLRGARTTAQEADAPAHIHRVRTALTFGDWSEPACVREFPRFIILLINRLGVQDLGMRISRDTHTNRWDFGCTAWGCKQVWAVLEGRPFPYDHDLSKAHRCLWPEILVN